MRDLVDDGGGNLTLPIVSRVLVQQDSMRSKCYEAPVLHRTGREVGDGNQVQLG